MSLLDFLQQHFMVYIIFIGVVGLCVGSFLNVVIYRLPIMLQRQWNEHCQELQGKITEQQVRFNLATPRSRCPQCNTLISAWQNIPLLSYLLLRGKCAHCQYTISISYFLIELTTGLLSAVIAWHFGISWNCAAALFLTWALIPLVMIDFKHQLLPDDITLPLLWLGLGINTFALFTPLKEAVIGAIAGYLSLWLFMQLYRLLTGKIGMGHGDFKLFAVFGAWLGWQVLPFIIFGAALLGACFGFAYLTATRQKKQMPIAFGPYLAIVGWLVLFFHQQFLQLFWIYTS